MEIPSVVIVGRPNVGKSSLFNVLYGRRVAIVEPTPGVTRDRLSRVVERDGTAFELWDTGGMGLHDEEALSDDIQRQIDFAIARADLVLMVVDARDGLQPLDGEIARQLRTAGKRVLVVANKCDRPADEAAAADFHALGFERIFRASAAHDRGIHELGRAVVELLPAVPAAPAGEEGLEGPMKIAFVGRRNVGKSTLVNYLANEPRVIVSEIPGTTRDAVDVRFRIGELEFVAIDTAGLRRRKQVKSSIDFYSQARAKGSVRRADVVVHMMDAPTEISRLDKQIADEVTSEYKPCILAINKMDLAEGVTADGFVPYVQDRLPGVAYAPMVFISALTGEGVMPLIETAQLLHEQSFVRVPTPELNRVLQAATSRQPPPSTPRVHGRIYYAAQVAVKPPTIVLFANAPELIADRYLRYLGNRFREAFAFNAIPIKFIVRARRRERGGGRH